MIFKSRRVRGIVLALWGGSHGGAATGMIGGMGGSMRSAPSRYLPPEATPTQVNGTSYYNSNGAYYQPEFNGSQVVYAASPT